MALQRVNVRLPADILEAVQLEASRMGVSASTFLATAGVAYLAVRTMERDPGALPELYGAASRVVHAFVE